MSAPRRGPGRLGALALLALVLGALLACKKDAREGYVRCDIDDSGESMNCRVSDDWLVKDGSQEVCWSVTGSCANGNDFAKAHNCTRVSKGEVGHLTITRAALESDDNLCDAIAKVEISGVTTE